MPGIFHGVFKKRNFKKDCNTSNIGIISFDVREYYQGYLHSDCDPLSFPVSQELGIEDDLLAAFVRQRVIRDNLGNVLRERIFNMLSRCADRETSMILLSC